MSFISSENAGSPRHRRRLGTAVKESLRELSIQLSLLNHQVGARVDLKDGDLGCLDLINLYGPLSPSALARRAATAAPPTAAPSSSGRYATATPNCCTSTRG